MALASGPMSYLARHSLAHPLLTVSLIGVVTLGLGAGIPRLALRTDGAALYPAGDPVVAKGTARQAEQVRRTRRQPRIERVAGDEPASKVISCKNTCEPGVRLPRSSRVF